MASLYGNCTLACKDKRSCWHVECKILRVFTSGKFLVENRAGYVIAAVPANLEFTETEQEKFKDETFDLCINTTSLGEMTNEMQNYYVNQIERLSKGYFYSVNRAKKRIEKFNAQGFYDLKFNKRWQSIIYNFTHTYHIEFLGKKLD